MINCCRRRHSFTIIEVLVALTLMAIIAGVVVLGVKRSLRTTQMKTSKERIERMLLQAFRFSAVSGHVGDVVIQRDATGAFEGYVNLWEKDSVKLCLLAQQNASIGGLAGIESLCLNGYAVEAATFRFFGGHGLTLVRAYDQFRRELSPSDFGFLPENITHRKRELEITLQPTKNPTPSEKISLDQYLLSVPHYIPIPDEYLTIGL